jgi:hypothetical protein
MNPEPKILSICGNRYRFRYPERGVRVQVSDMPEERKSSKPQAHGHKSVAMRIFFLLARDVQRSSSARSAASSL